MTTPTPDPEWVDITDHVIDATTHPGPPQPTPDMLARILNGVGAAMHAEHIPGRTIQRVMNRIVWGNPIGDPDAIYPIPLTGGRQANLPLEAINHLAQLPDFAIPAGTLHFDDSTPPEEP